MTPGESGRAAERAARSSYGKLLAILSRQTGDILACEDALAEAFARALETWPRSGVPANPDAWLLTTARNRATDALRRQARWPQTDRIPETGDLPTAPADGLRDDRLALMAVCAHPALAPEIHAPLMLQTVLGVEAADIARAFALAPAAMAQRLVRAKRKIRDAGIPFALPGGAELVQRLEAVREAIYAAHALDWLVPGDALGQEALYLADLLCALCPQEPECHGLLAVIAFTQSRQAARVVGGRLVALDVQDPELWDHRLIRMGQAALARAQALARPGRFQIEAAIQAVHLARADTGEIDWLSLDQLYFALGQVAPSLGASVAHAIVLAERHGPAAGLEALDRLTGRESAGFQPYWAARARLLDRLGAVEAAREAYCQALSLTADPPTRRHLELALAGLKPGR